MNKYIKKEKEVDDVSIQSDWNMGVRFYDSLDEIKRNQRVMIINKNYYEALLSLIEEIDWVAYDIDEKKRDEFRRTGNNLITTFNNTKNNNVFIKNFINLRRKLWDEEMKCGITRPKNMNDLSGVSITQINNR